MTTVDIVNRTIDRFANGNVFTYRDLKIEEDKRQAVIKRLNRLAAAGKLMKISKGKYYKPEDSAFGALAPDRFQFVKDLLEKDGELIGYISGYIAYNELGLSTQIPNLIQIAGNERRSAFQRGIYKIAFIKQKNIITKENIPLLKILDSLKYIKRIPDATIDESCIRLSAIVGRLNTTDTNNLIKLSLKYNPATIALLGAILENLYGADYSPTLKKALNSISIYKLRVSENVLPTAKNWNIV